MVDSLKVDAAEVAINRQPAIVIRPPPQGEWQVWFAHPLYGGIQNYP